MARNNRYNKQYWGGRGRGRGRVRENQRGVGVRWNHTTDRGEPEPENNVSDELAELRKQASILYEQLRDIHSRIDESSAKNAAHTAFIDASVCVGCGICVPVCPVNAIQISDSVAKIDQEHCTGCGACVTVCPKNAISMRN